MNIKGAFPVRWQQQGKDGKGVSVRSVTTQYVQSTQGTTPPSSGWQNTIPTVQNGNFLWTRTHIVFTDNTQTDIYSVARQGIDGKGIQSSVVTYSQQQNPVDPATITNWGAFPSTLNDGYWLYTKTHIVYSDGNPTDSYSVSQIGVGSYYAGCQEYWAIGTSDTTPPDGAATPGTYVSGQTINTSWSQQRQQTTAQTPFLWNFEISADSRGNRYVTQAICIGNFAKGIVSIVETYAISAFGTPESGRDYPSDIAAADWTDEQLSAPPTDAKPYQWNKTVVSYNSGTPDTFYHVSAVKGIDGKGAVYIDLDNENDSMLYDGAGVRIGDAITSNIYLYANGERVSNPPKFSIQEKSASVSATIEGNVLTVSGITANAGYVIVGCTYNSVPYTARMTLKRLVGVDKYELEVTPNNVTYNTTSQSASTVTLGVKVWRTSQGAGRNIVPSLSTYNLKLQYVLDNENTRYDFPSGYSSGQNLTIDPASHSQYKIYLVDSRNTNTVYDTEGIPIGKVENGQPGTGAITLDLDNDNDSMLYDGAGNLISGSVVAHGTLLVGSEDKTSDVTLWGYGGDYAGVEKSQIVVNGRTLTITGMSSNASSGYVDLVANYGGKSYKKRLTLKKLRGVDKYELVCNPSALTYNETTGQNPRQNVNIKVYRTGQDGVRSLVQSLATYGLKLRYYWITNGVDAGPTYITDGTASGNYNGGVTSSVYADMYTAYRYEVLNSGGLILDSETIPIGKNANGVGTPGASAKSVYRNSFMKPSTPTGSTPSGWTNQPTEQAEIKINAQGDWYLTDDGFLTAPLIGNGQTSVETLSFITTQDNQMLNFRLRCNTSSNDRVYIGNVDDVTPTASNHYIREVHGTNQDTGDLAVTVASPGAHFICVAYVRGSSGTSSYVKFICGSMFVWKSDSLTFNTDGTVATWTDPYKVSGKDAAFSTATKTNLLLQSNFIASRMDKWMVHNGSTTSGIEGRNAFHGTPQLDDNHKELLAQNMYEPNGDKRLLANTWYTLSFWAKASSYFEIGKYETSIYYGFAQSIVYFEAGVTNVLSINGYCSTTALNAGEELRVFVYSEGWGWSTSVAIQTTYATTASVSFEVPSTGKYFINSYVYKPGGTTPTAGKTCTINWYRINRGMRMVTFLYPKVGDGETQNDYTCIDVNAGRIIDGVATGYSSPTDNSVEWQLAEQWTKHTVTFKTRSYIPAKIQEFLVRMHEASNDVFICMPKIEQGTVATDYCTNDNDIADTAVDTMGFPRNKGVWNEEDTYSWDDTYRDYADYEFGGSFYRFGVRHKGTTIPANTPPTSVNGDDNWIPSHKIQTLITETIFGSNANIGGFMTTDERMRSTSVDESNNPKILLNGKNGTIRALDAYIKGELYATSGVFENVDVKGNLYTPTIVITEDNFWNCHIRQTSALCIPKLNTIGLNLLYTFFPGSSVYIGFPEDNSYEGAEVRIINTQSYVISISGISARTTKQVSGSFLTWITTTIALYAGDVLVLRNVNFNDTNKWLIMSWQKNYKSNIETY